MNIFCANPLQQYLAHRAEIDGAIQRVLTKGVYVKGQELESFEREFSSYVGARYGIGVANGTDALQLALRACQVGPGDEVITTSFTAVATVAAIELSGARPVLVDIDPESFTIDPAAVEAAISPKTRAVVAVHLYGQAADLSALQDICKRRKIRLIEDCAQATGASFRGKMLGSFGDLSCFSFYPTKNLGAVGDGGMVLAQDSGLAERLVLLREYGWKERYISEIEGLNSRLGELQAAVLRVKLRYLNEGNKKRQNIARRYNDAFERIDVITPSAREGGSHVYHLYVMRSNKRTQLLEGLKKKGIHAAIHYPLPVHLQPAYKGRGLVKGSMEVTEKVTQEVLSLPMYPELSSETVDAVISGVLDVVRS